MTIPAEPVAQFEAEQARLDAIFKEGGDAYRQATSRRANPYGDLTPEAEAWERGWLGEHSNAMLSLRELNEKWNR